MIFGGFRILKENVLLSMRDIMKHIWTILCQNSVVDQQSNSMSINNCIEALNLSLEKKFEQEPMIAVPVEYQMVSFWSREKNEEGDVQVDLRVDVVDPRKIILDSMNCTFVAKKEFKRMRNRWGVQGLKVSIPGDYLFVVYKKTPSGEYGLIAELPLEVNVEYK